MFKLKTSAITTNLMFLKEKLDAGIFIHVLSSTASKTLETINYLEVSLKLNLLEQNVYLHEETARSEERFNIEKSNQNIFYTLRNHKIAQD